jgi:hypothetical protein
MPASSSPICSRAPASRAWRHKNINHVNALADIQLRRTGLRFFAMVTGHETIETIHDINWKNFTATPSGSNAGRESRGGADFRRQRDQRPLIPKFSAPKNLQRPGRDAPLRVAPLLGNSQSGFPSCSYCHLPFLMTLAIHPCWVRTRSRFTSKASRTRDAAQMPPE